MSKTKDKPITDAQRRVLSILDDEAFLFVRGPQESACSRLESMGFVEGELRCRAVKYDNGFRETSWRRAYRITEAGKKFLEGTP